MDGIFAGRDRREMKQFFLDVRREVVEVQDLSHAGLGNVSEFGELGLAGDRALVQQTVETDSQCHQLGDARNARFGERAWAWRGPSKRDGGRRCPW